MFPKKLILDNVCRADHLELDLEMMQRTIGENSVGKSTLVFETLYIALMGETFPESMIRYGEKEAKITVVFDDGRSITRTRTKSKQTCVLTQADGAEKTFTTIKDKEVVDEIQAFTGFQPVVLTDKQKESFQFIAIDDPQTYLLTGVDAGTVLRKVTKIVGGTGAETAKARLEADLRKINSEQIGFQKVFDQFAARINETWGQIDLTFIGEAAVNLHNLEAVRANADVQFGFVSQLIDKYDATANTLDKIEEAYDPEKVSAAIENLRVLQNEHHDLVERAMDVDELTTRKRSLSSTPIAKAAEASAKIANSLTTLKTYDADLQAAVERCQYVAQLLRNEDILTEAVTGLKAQKVLVDREIAETKSQAEQVCFTCGQPLPEDQRKAA